MAEAKDAARAAPDTDTDGYVSVPIQLPESGTEKFVLRDGTTYVLKRRGHKPLRFKVPVRVKPVARAPEMDELVFPESIYID